ncbi:MAG: hypothetical protein K2G70_01065 [Turicibacter sp.]|nr:hypothetical protein [Turicibacter sp.]
MAEVDFSNIEPNSKTYQAKQKRERVKIDPVIKKEQIASTKKPIGKRLWDLFVGVDPKELRDYLVQDVIIPGLKDTVLDMVSMGLYGEPVNRGRGRVSSGGFGRVAYQNFFKDRPKSSKPERSNRSRGTRYNEDEKIDYRNIVLTGRSDAEMIVDHMIDRIVHAGSVSVAEFYDMLELPSKFTDNDWGWDDDRDVGVKKVHGGWLIDLSEAKHLD